MKGTSKSGKWRGRLGGGGEAKGVEGRAKEGRGDEGRNGKERRRRRKGPERDTELGARSSHGTTDADSERNSETMPCLLILLLLWRFRRDNKRTVGKQVWGGGGCW